MSDTLKVCGLTIERGTKLRTYLPVPDTNVKIPLTIINGDQDGPTLLITAGIHGGEYPGIAAAMELGRDIEPEHVAGCLIMMHPVNIQGFWARREMIVPEDGKNLFTKRLFHAFWIYEHSKQTKSRHLRSRRHPSRYARRRRSCCRHPPATGPAVSG